MDKTTQFKPDRNLWVEIDANNQILGRLATKIAALLSGKGKTSYAQSLDNGDHVVVINAANLVVSGKKASDKVYYRHTGYPGGIRQRCYQEIQSSSPGWVLFHAVKGMMPKNKLARKKLKRLRIYSGNSHPHQAQFKGGGTA